ncbi:3-hydroxyisobutyrate dehydrogenase/2-hydroxy-3-oxopropionate reductase [Inhella inkyongensis]|uniref:3-hydroxyisobutyrate dehydrogenase/2-hydroxy-3-oxopropionate reductase n=1 Tax=Inhella inkyongensis TaxID=392593 RepID=A0A840S7Z3_9BURK|nr:NAD(P)-dependent oxidoreductase [Inhella inkyongensis]MBB5204671.1 3-hydroxyisobutyrate dehydrogenase/2-hydroxy-3-oxopropionate reductase [Inhella inkyongensis]
MTAPRLAFVGLGAMGAPMAGHWAQAGHSVRVFNRRPEKAQAWVAQHGGVAAASPAQLAEGVDVVALCVGRDEDVRQVVTGPDGLLQTLAAGAVIVDHTTTSAELAREMAKVCAERGVSFVDAPVSGGEVGAQKGQLTVMCGGPQAAFAKAEPVLRLYAKAVTHLGESGAGQLAKMVNQICIAGVLQGLSEALAFGQRAGLDMPAVLKVIGQGAAQSWQMDQRGPTMLEDRFDFGFAVDWMRKDLGLVLDEARRNGSALPLTALVDQFYADVQAQGGGRWDTSSLIRRLSEQRNRQR